MLPLEHYRVDLQVSIWSPRWIAALLVELLMKFPKVCPLVLTFKLPPITISDVALGSESGSNLASTGASCRGINDMQSP